MGKVLDHLAAAFLGNKRQTGDKVLSIAQRGLKGAELTPEEIKSLCASVVSQARK